MPVDRTHVMDFAWALKSIDELCEKYASKGKDTWKIQPYRDQIDHVRGHLQNIEFTLDGGRDPNFEDFQSLAFRSLAALYQYIVLREKMYESNLSDR